MKQFTLIVASLYGLTSVILGAFGSHLFKQYLTPEKLISFEVAVRYQMYNAIVLLIIGLYFTFNSSLEKWSAVMLLEYIDWGEAGSLIINSLQNLYKEGYATIDLSRFMDNGKSLSTSDFCKLLKESM